MIVNTCSVTASADQGARQTIRRVARANPGARIVVTGCYASRRPDELALLPNVVRVVPNDDKPRLIPLTRVPAGIGDGPCGAVIEPGVAGRTAFTLRVQTGCAEPCSYCIIPTTRGAPRSVPVEDVLREVERVVAAGFKEIALTGVHLGSYGRDLASPSSLIDLLRALNGVRLKPDTTSGMSLRISSLCRWIARARSSTWSRRHCVRAALPSAAAAREQPYPSGDAPALHHRAYAALVDIRARDLGASTARTSSSASVGDDADFDSPLYLEAAADARARVSIDRPERRRRRWRTRCREPSRGERAAADRAAGRAFPDVAAGPRIVR